ncbi:LuxR family transcriptional regulator [Patescibacteria group bacterium]|nr:MAG: LuxR family transcriptional regulator [Patescibacteria group bacterium]
MQKLKIVEVDAEKLKLTPRQKEVWLLLACGNTDKKIAKRLGVSWSTAYTHRWNLLRKFKKLLGFRPTIADLVQIALALGEIENKFKKKETAPATKT